MPAADTKGMTFDHEQVKPVEIVLTGGPCSGKSTSLRYLVEHLSARGWRALVVPEAATMLITGGLHDIGDLAAHSRDAYLGVQENLLLLQSDLRGRFLSLADDLALHDPDAGSKTVIFYDRAELDNRAYMTAEEFTRVLSNALHATPGQVSARYDAIIHLVTAADGAEAHYSTANNEARTETAAEAVELDRAVQGAWLGHPHLHVIGNATNFDKKLSRTLAAVLNVLGEPEPVEIERKWLIAAEPAPALLSSAVAVDIEQTYLPSGPDGTERRVRARTHDGHTTHFYTEKDPTLATIGRVEREVMIPAETYRMMSKMQDPNTQVVRKQRYCFVSEGQHFELDHIIEPVDAWILEAELVTADTAVTLPETLDIDREVTDDLQWRNGALAANTTTAGSPAR